MSVHWAGCTSSKHQLDKSVVIDYQDGATELNSANACIAGPSA